MATPKQLVKEGSLFEVSPEDLLGPGAQAFREIYLLPAVKTWIENVLYKLEGDGVAGGKNNPAEQLYDHFCEFVSGHNIANIYWSPKRIRPVSQLVWELRTPDLRVFGWFWKSGIFIVSAIDTSARCKDHDLYGGYRNMCVHSYNSLDLDPPKAIDGDAEDVL